MLIVARWEYDLLAKELFQTRQLLHGIGIRHLAETFPGGLRNLNKLAQNVIEYYAVLPKSSPKTPIPSPFSGDASGERLEAEGESDIPATCFMSCIRTSAASDTIAPTFSGDSTSTDVKHHQADLLQPTPTLKSIAWSIQHLTRLTKSNQDQDTIGRERPRSPCSPALSQSYIPPSEAPKDAQAYVRPLKSRRLLAAASSPRRPAPPHQRHGFVGRRQHQASLQVPSTYKLPQAQQLYLALPTPKTDRRSIARCRPTVHWAWPSQYNASEAALSEDQRTCDTSTHQRMLPFSTTSNTRTRTD